MASSHTSFQVSLSSVSCLPRIVYLSLQSLPPLHPPKPRAHTYTGLRLSLPPSFFPSFLCVLCSRQVTHFFSAVCLTPVHTCSHSAQLQVHCSAVIHEPIGRQCMPWERHHRICHELSTCSMFTSMYALVCVYIYLCAYVYVNLCSFVHECMLFFAVAVCS